jgi:MFS family permease
MKIFKRLQYGYLIIVACFLIMTLVFGAQNTFGVFFKPMSSEFGWSRAETSGPFALCIAVSGLLTIMAGRLSDRYGTRIVVLVGGIIFGAGYMLMATIHHLWQLYIYYGILMAAGTSVMYIPIVSLIAKWFTKNRGAMSGIGVSGIGFGIAVMPALSSSLIEKWQWRLPFLIIGGVTTIAIIFLAQLLKNTRRAQIVPDKSAAAASIVAEKADFSLRAGVRTPQFWMLFVGWIGYGFFFQVTMVHVIPYATDLGMTAVAAATIMTVIGLVGTAGRISLGFVSDRLGNRRTLFVSFAMIGLAFLGLAVSHTIGMLYLFAVIFGFFSGVGIILVPLVAEYYGFSSLGVISGLIVSSNSLGGAAGPPVAGAIFDAVGSYHWAFVACAFSGLAAALLCYRLRRPLPPGKPPLISS